MFWLREKYMGEGSMNSIGYAVIVTSVFENTFPFPSWSSTVKRFPMDLSMLKLRLDDWVTVVAPSVSD